MCLPEDESYMRLAMELAKEAAHHGEVPVGALVVYGGRVLASARNMRESMKDPTAHAEVLALRAVESDSWRREGVTLYVTKEPCVMCAGAIVNARIRRLVYGCLDAKAGAVDSLYTIPTDPRLNHRVEVVSGVLGGECAGMLKEFFSSRRGG